MSLFVRIQCRTLTDGIFIQILQSIVTVITNLENIYVIRPQKFVYLLCAKSFFNSPFESSKL